MVDPKGAAPMQEKRLMKPKHTPAPWLKPKSRPPASAVGVVWYTEEEWFKVKNSATDPERFEDTYREWVDMAEKALSDLRCAGADAEKHHIVAIELLAWCIARGKANNAAARAEFVVDAARVMQGER